MTEFLQRGANFDRLEKKWAWRLTHWVLGFKKQRKSDDRNRGRRDRLHVARNICGQWSGKSSDECYPALINHEDLRGIIVYPNSNNTAY